MVRQRKIPTEELGRVARETREAALKRRSWPTLQQRGLRRTGSNWARTLIHKNFEVHLDDINKHGAYPPGGPEVDTVLMTRDIYSWLPSYHRLLLIKHGASIPPTLAEFISRVGLTDATQFDPNVTLLPIEFYCTAYRNWLDVEADKTIHLLKWEDLLFDQENQLSLLEVGFKLKRKQRNFERVSMEIGPKHYLHLPPGSEWSERDYNRNEEFMSLYTSKMLDHIANVIDVGVMTMLGYEIRS